MGFVEPHHPSKSEFPYDPRAAVYPDAPLPPRPGEIGAANDDALWRFAVTGEMEAAKPQPGDSWDEGFFLIGEMDEVWLPLARALRAAGVVAPDPDTVFRELTEKGLVTAYPAVMMWPLGERSLALVEEAPPPRAYDQVVLPMDPTAELMSSVRVVLEKLGGGW